MPGTARLVPIAVGTAGVVRRLPDSGLVHRLTRGRAWIGVLSVLLTGIVALNVLSLSLSASEGKLAQQAQILAQENSALRARLAERLSAERIRSAAAAAGMVAPESTEINYRDASGEALKLAVRRLADGFSLGTSLVVEPTPYVPIPEATESSATVTPVAPVESVDPTTTSATATAVSAPPVGATAGGVSPG
jgi:hypothetical protein